MKIERAAGCKHKHTADCKRVRPTRAAGALGADATSGQSSSDSGQGLTGTDVAEFLTDLLVSPSEAQ